MPNELSNYKKSRSCIRGLLTRIENQLQREEIDFPAHEIRTRIQSVNDISRKYEECQQNIESLTEEADLEAEIQNRYEFLESTTKVLNILNKKNTTAYSSTSNTENGIETTSSPENTRREPQVPKIHFLPFNEKETFKNFIRRLELYISLNHITNATTKTHMLLAMISPDLHEKAYDLCSPDDPTTMKFEDLTKVLSDYIDPMPGPYALQHKFISRLQTKEETVVNYAAELKKLTANCEFQCHNCEKSISENFLCLQFIRGLFDSEIRTKLLQNRKILTFSEIVQIASALEMGKSDNEAMTMQRPATSDPIHQVTTPSSHTSTTKQKPTTMKSKPRSPQLSPKDLRGKCFRCGKDDHRSNECGAINETCFKCQKRGHLGRVCLQRNRVTNQLDEPTDDSTCDIHLIKSETSEKFMITIEIENKPIAMEFDTGAALSTMSLRTFKALNLKNRIFKTDVTMKTYTNELIRPVGVSYIKGKYQDQNFQGKLYIIDKPVDPILGRSWMKDLKLELADIKALRTERPLKLDELLKTYESSVFSPNLGEIPNYRAHLTLNENTQPIFIKPRRVPYALKKKVDDEIDRLCAERVITKVEQSDWGTPIVPIVKPNGSIRLCADYKVTLNKVIKDEQYPIPIIEDIFAEMNGGEIFCTLDISQAYLNMVMDEESAHLQTLSTHKGTYKVNRLMFGVKVAPNLWQKFMDRLLQGIEGVKCFFDDIIIQGSTENELLTRLNLVLEKLKQSNLRVNKDKCHFFQRSINYLGHTIDKHGLHKNKDKVKAILNAPRPKNVNELRTFLGMANYYNKFIPNLASITNPMNNLLRKHKSFIWTDTCEKSFNRIKQEIASETTLIHFDPQRPLVLATDASPVGLGAVLSHRLPDGSERPIAFASRTLTDSEKKYSQIDKEATSIFWGLKKFFHYCYGRKFLLVTDHKPLTTIFHPHKTLPAMSTMRLFHYAHFLSGFDYDIEYKKSADNGNADYLSRFPVEKANIHSVDQHSLFQISQIHLLTINQDKIAEETRSDPELAPLLASLRTGNTMRHHGYSDSEITAQDDCVFKGPRVMIPKSLHDAVLTELHAGHIGMHKMKLLARSHVYWRNIDKDIENKVKSCRACRLQQNEPEKVPQHHWEDPIEPWQRVHIDFAGPIMGHQLFILVDAFTKWVEIIPTKTTTSTWCINQLKETFCTFGMPYMLVSDNARQFTSHEFENFLKDHGVTHRTSAPYHPASNGQAERFVQTVKRSLRCMEGQQGNLSEKLQIIKTQLRRVPNASGHDAYSLMFGRDIRTKLHVMFKKQTPRNNGNNRPSRPRPTEIGKHFAVGERVQVRCFNNAFHKWQFGTVVRRLGRLHYTVATEEGELWRRHVDQMLSASLVPPPR